MTPPTRLSVADPAELATVIPHMLGFHPQESLVLVGTRGPRRRLGMTLRMDLVAPADEPALARQLAQQIKRSGADQALAVVFTGSPGTPPNLPRRSLIDRVRPRLPLIDAVLVRGDRWWSYLCTDPTCCPLEGRPVDPNSAQATRIRAAFATVGASVLPSREAVVETLAPESGPRAAAAADAVDAALEWRRSAGAVAAGQWARAELARQVAHYADPRVRVPPELAVRIAVALEDIETRDRVLADWVTAVGNPRRTLDEAADASDPADAWRRLLLDLVRVVPAPHDVQPLVLFGCAAYHEGTGVLVETAAERALAHDPTCGMAKLLLELLDVQAHPDQVVAALTDAKALLG